MKLLNNKNKNNIYIPHRLCNVVELAALQAGLKVIFYKDIYDFQKKIKNEKNEPILLVATYFKQINQKQIIADFINKFGKDSIIIFDESQSVFDFYLYKQYKNLKNKYLVISFNDKFIPGIMGGVLITEDLIKIKKIKKLSFKQELLFVLYYIKT